MGRTTAKGLGWPHQRERARLLRDLKAAGGALCPLCGGLMAAGMDLDVDHVTPRSRGGVGGPVRLAHASCNRSRGARGGPLVLAGHDCRAAGCHTDRARCACGRHSRGW